MAYDSRRQAIIMFGGEFDPILGRETWGYSVSTHKWSVLASQGPASRNLTAMCFDSHRNVVVLFGGRLGHNGPIADDTWEWDGNSWTHRASLHSPSPRNGHAMVFDEVRGVSVLYGGNGLDASARETWEWNGEDWTLRATDGPAGRTGHAMAYDRDRGVTVLFGGNASTTLMDDTWEWNGSSWALRSLDGPPARTDHGMVFDSNIRRVVMLGGYPADHDRVWTWDGLRWNRSISEGPHLADRFAMAFDSRENVTVLFGGSGANATWELRLRTGPEILSVTPQYSVVDIGETLSLHVQAPGDGLSYRWRRDGIELVDGPNVSGSASPTLTIVARGAEQEGRYDVFVLNDVCAQLSDDVFVNVISSTGDINGDGHTDVNDLLLVIQEWGFCYPCTADVNEDGDVNVDDLIFVILHWTG
jgi:hypothetical protein